MTEVKPGDRVRIRGLDGVLRGREYTVKTIRNGAAIILTDVGGKLVVFADHLVPVPPFDPRLARLREAVYLTTPRNRWQVRDPSTLPHLDALVAAAIEAGEVQDCPECEGNSIKIKKRRDTYQGNVKYEVDCPNCRGLGKVVVTA